MKTIAQILELSAQFLKGDKPKRLAEELLAHVLSLKRMDLYLQHDRPVIEKELEIMRALLKRCAAGEPPEYAMGVVEFLGCKIQVDRRVLIPRPETEILADQISKVAKEGVLWDICTGSGCIGISLKKKNPALQVTLADISPDALAVAKVNAEGLDVEIVQGDLLALFQGKKADFVVCNPPYITEAEFLTLDPSVKDFEPRLALVGGLDFYQRLSRELPAFLNPGARVFLEIGAGQGEAVKEIFSSPIWARQELKQDWAGKSRFFFLEKQ